MYKERETEFHFAQAQITLKLEEVVLEDKANSSFASSHAAQP